MREVHLKHIDFRWVWAKVLPQVYDDTLSYYEQLCKLGAALDELATQCEEHFEEIYALIEIIQAELNNVKSRVDTDEQNITDLIRRTGVLEGEMADILELVPDVSALETKTEHLNGGTTGQVLIKRTNTDYDFEWHDIEGIPAYSENDIGKILSVVAVGGTPGTRIYTDWVDPPTDIPSFYTTDEGKVLKVFVESGVAYMDWGLGVPEVSASDANKILAVNSNGDGVEWKTQEGTIPSYGYEDRNKALCVNNSASGVEWAYRQNELPPYDLEKSFWVLSVDRFGTGVFWQNNKVLGVEAFEGHGLPVDSIVAKTGDIYRDVDTDKLYWCVRYIDPDNITDLQYLGAEFNPTIDFSQIPFVNASVVYNLSFDLINPIGGRSHVQSIRFDNQDNTYYSYWCYLTGALGYDVAYQSVFGRWNNNNYKTIKNIGGTDSTNADLINWFTVNATLTGTGSTWVEVSKLLPIYDYNEPLHAPSFRVKGDYKLTGSVNAGVRTTVYLTGATTGTYGRVYVRNTATNYTKKYEFMFMGNTGFIVDNNPTPTGATEDWFIEPTVTGEGYLTLNSGSNPLAYELVACYDYKP